MNNDLVENKSWINKNWKWLAILTAVFLLGCYALFNSKLGNNVVDISKAYAEKSLYENALVYVEENDDIRKVIGALEPIDNFAILEGSVKYLNDNKSIETTIRLKGDKGKGKLDISADKNGSEWHYKKIKVRLRNPNKQTIIVLE